MPFACYCNSASMPFDYSLSDGQAQARAAYPATARLVSAVEAVSVPGIVELSQFVIGIERFVAQLNRQ